MQPAEVNILRFFDSEQVEEMARACEFVRRRSPVTGMRFLLTFTTGLLNTPDGTLAQLAAFLGGTCGAEVSAQAVDQRISALAQDFLGRCLSAALRISAATQWGADDVLGWFDHLYVIDSTNFSLDPALAGATRKRASASTPNGKKLHGKRRFNRWPSA